MQKIKQIYSRSSREKFRTKGQTGKQNRNRQTAKSQQEKILALPTGKQLLSLQNYWGRHDSCSNLLEPHPTG